MAKEVLVVPESLLEETIRVIRAGLKSDRDVSQRCMNLLNNWCDEEEKYIETWRDLSDPRLSS